jgi:hypothetical protein
MKNGMVKEKMLSCAPIEISANDPVGLGANEHLKYLNAQHCLIMIKQMKIL